MTRFGGGFATGIGGQLGLLDLYHQLLVLSFPLPGKHSHAGGHRFGTFLTDWLSAVCGVVVLLHLASHLVVIGGGKKRSLGEQKERGRFSLLFSGHFSAWHNEVYEAWIKARCLSDRGQ